MNSRFWRILGITLLLVVVLSYEIYFTIFLVLLLTEPVIKYLSNNEEISWAPTAKKFSIFIAISGFYILQVLMTRWIFGEVSGRGFVNITSLSAFFGEKIHGIINLIVNCYMPVLSYYTGILVAWSGWKWIPISIAIITFLVAMIVYHSWSKSLFFGAFTLIILIISTLPIFVMSQSPESWRVSIVVLFAVCLSLIPAILMLWNIGEELKRNQHCREILILSRGLSIAALLGIIAFEIPVTFAEARLRLVENNMDRSLVQMIKDYWETKGVSSDQFRVGVITNLGLRKGNVSGYESAERITQAYHSRGLISALYFDFSWRGFLMYNGIYVVELGDFSRLGIHQKILKGCEKNPEMCRLDLRDRLANQCMSNPNYEQPETGWRVNSQKLRARPIKQWLLGESSRGAEG